MVVTNLNAEHKILSLYRVRVREWSTFDWKAILLLYLYSPKR